MRSPWKRGAKRPALAQLSLPEGAADLFEVSQSEALCLAIEPQLPGIAHQLCQYHYLKDLAKPAWERDRQLKIITASLGEPQYFSNHPTSYD